MKKTLLLLVVQTVIFSQSLKASPGNYYNSIDTNKTCSNFKTTLFNLIKNDTHLNYGDIDNNYYRTDQKANENGAGFVLVERYCSENPTGLDYCSFTGVAGSCGGSFYCQCYNKEHVVPASWFNGTSTTNIIPRTDMHTLWPADSKANEEKNNYPIGYVKTASSTTLNGTRVGTSDPAKNYGYSGGSIKVFEPIDSFKGDFARAYLYFVTRYQDSVSTWRKYSISDSAFSGTSYTGLDPWILKLCVQWHKMDPPSAFEQKRNDSVYAIQGNRNPYIDYPNWVEKVFGENGNDAACVSSGIRNTRSVELSVYPNPGNNWVNIRIGSVLAEDAVLEVSDITGRKLMVQPIRAFEAVKTMDVSALSKGIYFLNIVYQNTSNVTTFIKE